MQDLWLSQLALLGGSSGEGTDLRAALWHIAVFDSVSLAVGITLLPCIFLGFFQMAGFNRYAVDGERRLYVDLLEDLDGGTYESSRAGWLGAPVDLSGVASRDILRKEWRKEDLKAVPSSAGAADLLPNVAAPWLPSLEADMPLEYLPFSVAKLGFPNATCDAVLGTRAGQFWPGFCGVAVQRARSCDCWINLPTFKSRTFVADLLGDATGRAWEPEWGASARAPLEDRAVRTRRTVLALATQ